MRFTVPVTRLAPTVAARERSHSSKSSRSTMPTKPSGRVERMSMSTVAPDGAIMRAARTRATSSEGGMAKCSSAAVGMAPPHGLMRPARSISATERCVRASRSAAVAPAGPPPTTATSTSVTRS